MDEYYNKNKRPKRINRNQRGLENHWGKVVSRNVSKYSGYYSQVKAKPTSGSVEVDYVNDILEVVLRIAMTNLFYRQRKPKKCTKLWRERYSLWNPVSKFCPHNAKWAEWDAVTKQKAKEKRVEASGKEVAIVGGSLSNDTASSSPVPPIGRKQAKGCEQRKHHCYDN
jgi:hypothetical protein